MGIMLIGNTSSKPKKNPFKALTALYVVSTQITLCHDFDIKHLNCLLPT